MPIGRLLEACGWTQIEVQKATRDLSADAARLLVEDGEYVMAFDPAAHSSWALLRIVPTHEASQIDGFDITAVMPRQSGKMAAQQFAQALTEPLQAHELTAPLTGAGKPVEQPSYLRHDPTKSHRRRAR